MACEMKVEVQEVDLNAYWVGCDGERRLVLAQDAHAAVSVFEDWWNSDNAPGDPPCRIDHLEEVTDQHVIVPVVLPTIQHVSNEPGGYVPLDSSPAELARLRAGLRRLASGEAVGFAQAIPIESPLGQELQLRRQLAQAVLDGEGQEAAVKRLYKSVTTERG